MTWLLGQIHANPRPQSLGRSSLSPLRRPQSRRAPHPLTSSSTNARGSRQAPGKPSIELATRAPSIALPMSPAFPGSCRVASGVAVPSAPNGLRCSKIRGKSNGALSTATGYLAQSVRQVVRYDCVRYHGASHPRRPTITVAPCARGRTQCRSTNRPTNGAILKLISRIYGNQVSTQPLRMRH